MGLIWNTKDFQMKMTSISNRMNAMIGPIAQDGATSILSFARPEAPIKTGALRALANVNALSGAPGFVVMQIEFSSRNPKDGFDYAEIQHKTTWYKHPRGGRYHYLSIIIDQKGGVFIQEVMNGVQRVLM